MSDAAVSTRLPTFLVVGAAKSGTTSLAAHLRTNREVFVPEAKELFFFSSTNVGDDRRDLDWYARQFAPADDAVAACGEATPLYLTDPVSPALVSATIPDVKVIALLREPVGRAWSHYWHARRRHVEHRSFRDAIRDERRGEGVVEFGYEATGRYVEHLERWAAHIPAGAIKAFLLDDLERDPGAVYDDVCRFIGVDPAAGAPDFSEVHNRGHHVRSYRFHHVMWERKIYPRLPRRLAIRISRLNQVDELPAMAPDDRRELVDAFREPNRALAAWLGRDLPPGWST